METAFFIVFNIKTPLGFENFARFYIGNKEAFARNLFTKLKGSTDNLELAENGKVITKEAFKIFTLES